MGSESEDLTVDDVQSLAREGRVAPDPAYHAFRFERIVNLLCLCVRIDRDRRAGHEGGFVAWSQNWAGERFRIDFNLGRDGRDERMILVVTAMHLEEPS